MNVRNRYIRAACVGLSVLFCGAGFAQVSLDIQQPTNTQSYSSPVPVRASASSPAGITGWEIYVDSKLAFKNNDTSGDLNTFVDAAAGGHTFVIKAWDSAGDNTAATETITVISGPTVTLAQPTPGSTVNTTFPLQASCTAPATITGWEVYIDSQTPPYFKNTANSGTLNIQVSTTTGAHNLNVKCWDADGVFGQVNFSIMAQSLHPSVQILNPSQGATVSSPFTLQASCSSPSASISGWEVYIDSQTPPFFKNNTNSSSLNIPVSVASGSHSIDVKCWNVNGDNGSSILNVTVGGGLIPTPPTNATPFPDIDQMTGWQSCDDSSCSAAPPTSPTFAQNVASPSLDGRAIKASVANGPAFWGILWYRHLGAENLARNFVVEWNYQINAGANPQALEFDFPLWSGGKSFYFGTQCDVAGGFWQYWIPGSANHGWHNITQAACPAVTTGVWHKLRWYGTISGSNFTYNAMELDGKQIAVNITVPAGATNFADEFTVQFQFDGRGNGAGYTEYIDGVNAWIW